MAGMTYELSEARLGNGLERLRNNKILCDTKLEANGKLVHHCLERILPLRHVILITCTKRRISADVTCVF